MQCRTDTSRHTLSQCVGAPTVGKQTWQRAPPRRLTSALGPVYATQEEERVRRARRTETVANMLPVKHPQFPYSSIGPPSPCLPPRTVLFSVCP